MDRPYGELFGDALVSEIKAEMGRRDLSSRALGRLIGKSSQYMSDRLDGGSSKTGQRVVLSVHDLAAISEALELRVTDLTSRAHRAALGVWPDEVVDLELRRVGRMEQDLREAASSSLREDPEDTDDQY